MKIKIACISDTHKMHNQWYDNLRYGQWGHEVYERWQDADIILHAGDLTSYGYKHEVQQFLKWFNSLSAPSKIFIAGNHDFFFDTDYRAYTEMGKRRHHHKSTDPKEIEEVLKPYPHVTYLNEESTEAFGLKIYGTPIQPWFHDWAFNRMRGDDIQQHWDKIPDDADVIIVHGPPYGIMDLLHPKFREFNEDPNVGCKNLLKRIREINPKLVVFGHVHEGYGTISKEEDLKEYYKLLEKKEKAENKLKELYDATEDVKKAIQNNILLLDESIKKWNPEAGDTIFVNASCLNENYRPMNPPQFVTLEI